MFGAGSSLSSLLFLFACMCLVASAPVSDRLGSLTSLSGRFDPYHGGALMVRSVGHSVKGSARHLSDVGYEPIFPRSPKGRKQAAPKAAPRPVAPKPAAAKPAAPRPVPRAKAPKPAAQAQARKGVAPKPQQAKAQGPAKPHLSVGQKIKAHFQRVGQSIKQGFQKLGQKVKTGFQTFARKAKAGFQKVGRWFKETGKKVVKFGLKVAATVASVASRVAKFIPGVGSSVSAALNAESQVTNMASDSIHADLGKKLNKGVQAMDIIQDPLGAGVNAAVGAAQKKIQSRHR